MRAVAFFVAAMSLLLSCATPPAEHSEREQIALAVAIYGAESEEARHTAAMLDVLANRFDQMSLYPYDRRAGSEAAQSRIEAARASGTTEPSALLFEAVQGMTSSLGHNAGAQLVSAETQTLDETACSQRSLLPRADGLIWIDLREFCLRDGCTPTRYYSGGIPQGGRVVVDLRGNHGGLLDDIACVTAAFVPNGAHLYSLRAREGIEETHSPDNASGVYAWQGQLVVLIDENTNVGALMVAAILQGHAGARLVGRAPGVIVDTVRTAIPFNTDANRGRRGGGFILGPGSILVLVPTAQLLRSDGSALSDGLRADTPPGDMSSDGIAAALFPN